MKTIWLSYDLCIDGDYEGLYSWLDKRGAKDCGDNVAVFEFNFDDNFLDELKKSLSAAYRSKENDRIYVIYRDNEETVKGKFIFGRRKVARWKGYAVDMEEDIVDVEYNH